MNRNISLAQLRFAEHVRPDDVIGWPQGPGEPLALTEALVVQRADLTKTTLFFGLSSSDTLRPEHADHFAFRALNGAGTNRRISALADIVPCHVSSVSALLRSGDLRVDVALIQVKPLPGGDFTLGVIADFTQAMIREARIVIALVNPALPATLGDARVDLQDIDILVESDDRLIDMPDPEPSAVERSVAEQVVALIPDRATIQLGIGTLPAAVARALSNHHELGVHSGVVSDVLVDLVERGVVTNAQPLRPEKSASDGARLRGTQRPRGHAQRGLHAQYRSHIRAGQIPHRQLGNRSRSVGPGQRRDCRRPVSRCRRWTNRFRARRWSIPRRPLDHRLSSHHPGRQAFPDRRLAARPSRDDGQKRRRRYRDGVRCRAPPGRCAFRTRAAADRDRPSGPSGGAAAVSA